MTTAFDSFVMVDWNAGNDTGPTPKKDAIWVGEDDGDPTYLRNRPLAEAQITNRIKTALQRGETLCLGFDFGFAYPTGLATELTGSEDPFALWDWFETRVEDSPKSNNRFDMAALINSQLPGIGPFWGNGLKRDIADLPRKGNDRTHRWANPKRHCETLAPGTFECWQLSGAGAVGSQIIMGLPMLARLRRRFEADIAVWPFDSHPAPITIVEIWPSLIAEQVRRAGHLHPVRDAVQVTLLAQTLASLGADIQSFLDVPQTSEGWILGVGHEEALRTAAEALCR